MPLTATNTGGNPNAPPGGFGNLPSANPPQQNHDGKKGRGGEKSASELNLNNAEYDTGVQQAIQPGVTGFDESLVATQPGQLSPYAASQYGSDLENVNSTYNNLASQGFKLLGATGFGSAPSGRSASMINNILAQKGQAQTGAYRNALSNTLNEGLAGASQLQGQESIFNPTSPASSAQTGFANLNKMGSTAGDIATGVADAATIAAAVPTGGASLLALPGINSAQGAGSGATNPAAIPQSYGGTAPESSVAPASSTVPYSPAAPRSSPQSLWG